MRCMRVRFFVTASGASPVEKYLDGLDRRERAAVFEALTELEESGLAAPGVAARQIGGKLWEIKASQQRLF